jgi:hypothetical protein
MMKNSMKGGDAYEINALRTGGEVFQKIGILKKGEFR